jgi:hypothetical protein
MSTEDLKLYTLTLCELYGIEINLIQLHEEFELSVFKPCIDY